jgi:hypothetical protein
MLSHPIHGECFSLCLGWKFGRYLSPFLRIIHFPKQHHQVVYTKLFLRDNQILACGFVQESSLVVDSPPTFYFFRDSSPIKLLKARAILYDALHVGY